MLYARPGKKRRLQRPEKKGGRRNQKKNQTLRARKNEKGSPGENLNNTTGKKREKGREITGRHVAGKQPPRYLGGGQKKREGEKGGGKGNQPPFKNRRNQSVPIKGFFRGGDRTKHRTGAAEIPKNAGGQGGGDDHTTLDVLFLKRNLGDVTRWREEKEPGQGKGCKRTCSYGVIVETKKGEKRKKGPGP